MTPLPALVLFTVSISGTPGPNNIMVTASGANFGFRRTVPHMAGIAIGFPVMVLMVGIGLGSVMIANPEIHHVLRWFGVAYMLWLAVRIAMARRPESGDVSRSRPLTFLEAALFQWVNPKAWIAVAAAVSTFVSLDGSLWAQIAVIATVFMLVTLPVVAAWTGIGSGASAVLRTERQFRLFNLTMAGLLALSVVSLFYEA